MHSFQTGEHNCRDLTDEENCEPTTQKPQQGKWEEIQNPILFKGNIRFDPNTRKKKKISVSTDANIRIEIKWNTFLP